MKSFVSPVKGKTFEIKEINQSQLNVYWEGCKVSMISLDIEHDCVWVYEKTGFQSPSFEECAKAAKRDRDERVDHKYHEGFVRVVEVKSSQKPTYQLSIGTAWRHVGAGDSTKVEVEDNAGKFEIWIPSSFAAKLIPGQIYEHVIDPVDSCHGLAYL